MLSPHQPDQPAGEVPEWASFFTLQEYQSFIQAIESYFNKLDIQHQIHDGVVYPQDNEMGFDKMGLFNLAQLCRMEEPISYPDVIEGHFNSIRESHQFMKEFEQQAEDFEAVKKYIGVRLYHEDYAGHLGKDMVLGKPLAGDIFAMLVFDLPQSVMNVQPHYLETWGKSLEELFELGKQNIQQNYVFDIDEQETGPLSIFVAHADHFFTPNIALELDERAELLGRRGALLALPHRHTALIYPINSMEVIQALNLLLPAVHGMHQEGPGSLSNQLFWYHEGQFTVLPYQLKEEQLQFQPPEEFVQLLNKMSQEN